MRDMREETALYSLWRNYAAENSYAEGLEFHVLLDTATEIAELIGIDSKLEIKKEMTNWEFVDRMVKYTF